MERTYAEVSTHGGQPRELRRVDEKRGDKPNLKKDDVEGSEQTRVSRCTRGMSVDLRVSDHPWFKSLAPNLHDSPANVETTIRSLNFI